jgi:hypothetical protein
VKPRQVLVIAALVAALAFVFADQAPDAGFRAGHRGWVSSHTLAIAQNATPATGFVGYAASLRTRDGRELYYFDRYPVFFSIALHAAMHAAGPGSAARILASRQLMNAVYVLIVLAAVGLLVELGLPVEAAVAAAALAASSFTMVEYRDMVHFDQPALLGSVLLLWSIARTETGRAGAAAPLLATVFAVSAGRGYASLVTLALWSACALVRAIARRRRANEAAPSLAIPFACLACGAALSAALLTYNVATEARLRDVPWSQTSILSSARKRLALDQGFNQSKEQRLEWPHFLEVQATNLANTTVPWSWCVELRRNGEATAIVAASMIAIVLAFVVSRSAATRVAWLVTAASGALWLLMMRNLSAFHPYTAMFLFPLCLVACAPILSRVPRVAGVALAVAACALLVACTRERNDELRAGSGRLLAESSDMDEIAWFLEPAEPVAAERRLLRGVPFALAFYLPGHDIQAGGKTSMMLVRKKDCRGRNLTPANTTIVVCRLAAPARARSSLARHIPGLAAPAAQRNPRARPALVSPTGHP